MKKILEVENLSTYYHTFKGVMKSVDHISFSMNEGEAYDMGYVLYNIDPSTAKVTWSVKDPAFLSVDQDGVIVARKSTWGIDPSRNYTVLTVTCGNYSCDAFVFIRKEQ